MKILQVIPVFSDFFGGPVFDVRSVSKRLAVKHEVTVLTTTACDWNNDIPPKEAWIDGYRVVYLPRIGKVQMLRDLHICKGLYRYLEKMDNFDVIHLHAWRQYMEVLVYNYARKKGIPYIHQSHGGLDRSSKPFRKLFYDTIFGKTILSNAAKVIALTESEASEYKIMGVKASNISTIPNGIELEEHANLPPEGSFKRRYKVADNKKIILYLGRLHKTKGIDFLIKAYASLMNSSVYEKTVLVIAGPDDGYLQEAKKLASSLGIGESIIFPGLLSGSEKISAFVDSSICAYLRFNEPFGRVILEAAASGIPVVVNKSAPLSKIVHSGSFGFSVKNNDIAELRNVLKAVVLDKTLGKKLGLNGRKYVFENFGWDKITDQLEFLYEQIMLRN
jgi:glycosyltransferase involved in cell wall biosynthesis